MLGLGYICGYLGLKCKDCNYIWLFIAGTMDRIITRLYVARATARTSAIIGWAWVVAREWLVCVE